MSKEKALSILNEIERSVLYNISECAAIKLELHRIETELLTISKIN